MIFLLLKMNLSKNINLTSPTHLAPARSANMHLYFESIHPFEATRDLQALMEMDALVNAGGAEVRIIC